MTSFIAQTHPRDPRDATIALMDADPSLDFAMAEAAALERAADARDWARDAWLELAANAEPVPQEVE